MALHLTPAMIEAAYELLRVTPPFRAWKLPHADDIEFHVMRTEAMFADADRVVKTDGSVYYKVRVSSTGCRTLDALLRTLAHEMIHIKLGIDGCWRQGSHGRQFRRHRKSVCSWHCWDVGTF